MASRMGNSFSKKSQKAAVLTIVVGLLVSLGVFQNCSKKGSAKTGNTGTAGYVPKKLSVTESFGFGDRGPASVTYFRSAGRILTSGVSQSSQQILMTGSIENGRDKDAAVIRLGLDGELQSATVIAGLGQEDLRGQAVDSRGRLIAVGSTRFSSAQGYSRQGLVVVDDNGNVKAKTLSGGVVTGLSAVASQGSDTVVVGFTSDSVRSEVKAPFIAALDSNQQVLWSGRLTGVGSGEFLAVAQTNNEIVAVGYSGNSSALIARFALNGSLIGVQSLKLGESSQALTVAPLADGGWLLGGAVGARGTEKGFVAKVSANLVLEWASLSEGDGKIQSVGTNKAGQLLALGSMVTEVGTRNAVSFRFASDGSSVGQSVLGGQAATFANGQSLSAGESGALVAINAVVAESGFNPPVLVRLDEDFSDCDFVRPTSSGFIRGRAATSERSGNLADGRAQINDVAVQLSDLKIAGEGQCF